MPHPYCAIAVSLMADIDAAAGVCVVVLCGLPGSGKSTVAAALTRAASLHDKGEMPCPSGRRAACSPGENQRGQFCIDGLRCSLQQLHPSLSTHQAGVMCLLTCLSNLLTCPHLLNDIRTAHGH